MHGQLYRGHANATALFSSPVVSALGSESDDAGSSRSSRSSWLLPCNVIERITHNVNEFRLCAKFTL